MSGSSEIIVVYVLIGILQCSKTFLSKQSSLTTDDYTVGIQAQHVTYEVARKV